MLRSMGISSALFKRIRNLGEGHVHFGLRKMDAILLVLLALLAATIMFWRLGEGSLGDYDEAAYAQIAQEMLWLNDFNTPRWNGMEFFDKPPLCLWLTVLAYKVFGINEFAARFVSACSGVLVILLVYILGRDLFGKRVVGLGAALILLAISRNLSSHGYNFVSLARVGMLDLPLILLLTLSVYCAWRGQRDARWLIWLGIPLGLGLMVKSIAGFMAYGIVALFLLSGSTSLWWRKELLWGLLLSLLISAPWHLGQLLIWGKRFWDSYMVSLTVGYVTGEQGHMRDALFYFRIIQRGFPVLYLLIVPAILYGVYRALRYKDRATALLLCWTIVPLLLYNISRSKIGWYIIPIYPALALLLMNLLVAALRKELALLLILIVLVAFHPILPPAKDFNPDVKAVASYSRYVVSKDATLINYWPGSSWIRPSALFYAGRKLLLVTDETELRRLCQNAQECYVLADWPSWEPLQEIGEVLYRSRDYVLVKAKVGVQKGEGGQ
ncbi:MAG: glycosyltransferase family 39 protein [Chloroflexi bacterium]|nr:glycosyltransferase family 39 protein [Chloroflexota bacterium]